MKVELDRTSYSATTKISNTYGTDEMSESDLKLQLPFINFYDFFVHRQYFTTHVSFMTLINTSVIAVVYCFCLDCELCAAINKGAEKWLHCLKCCYCCVYAGGLSVLVVVYLFIWYLLLKSINSWRIFVHIVLLAQ